MIVETRERANASFACGLAGGTTCVFVTNPLISTTTEKEKKKGRRLVQNISIERKKV